MYISDVAVSVGLTAQALRFYERLGLVDKPQRTSGGYRVYSAKTLEQVQFIKDAERLGFSLDEVREILRLKYSGQSPCDCVREMLNQKLKGLKKQIQQMDQVRREIAVCLRASQKRARLPNTASLICLIVQNKGVRSPAPEHSR